MVQIIVTDEIPWVDCVPLDNWTYECVIESWGFDKDYIQSTFEVFVLLVPILFFLCSIFLFYSICKFWFIKDKLLRKKYWRKVIYLLVLFFVLLVLYLIFLYRDLFAIWLYTS